MKLWPKKIRRNSRLFFLIFLIFIFGLFYSFLSLRRHARFDSFAYDLGIFDQTVWLYSQFKLPFNTIKGKLILADHFSPSLVLLSPLFWLWDDVRFLLIFQAFWLAFSAWPIFLLAKKKLSFWPGLAMSALYLSFFGFQHAINFDFHASVIAAGLAAWLLYFWEKNHWLVFSLLAVFFIGFKENLALSLVALGLVSFWKKPRRLAWLMIGFSLVYFLTVVKWVIPFFSGGTYEYQPKLPKSLFGYLQGLFWPKIKIETWLYSLAWFSFLPLLFPLSLIPVAIDLGQYFLAGAKYAGTWGLFMHYRASLAPFLAWGAIEGLAVLKKRVSFKYWWLIIILPALMIQYFRHLPLNRLFKAYFWQEKTWMKNNRQLISKVGKQASVVAQNNLVPHLSHRKKIYLLWPRKKEFLLEESPCGRKSCWWLFWSGQPEYLIVDLHPGQAITHLLVKTEVELSQAIENMERMAILNLLKSKGESRLYQIDYSSQKN